MNTAEYVDQLVITLKNEGVPLSDAAWETALACVDFPYVFGAWGELCTPSNRKRRAREDHPTIVSACQVLNGKKTGCAGCKWYPEEKNVRMFDCRGFTDWVLKQFGIDLVGEGATSQWNTEANWAAKGEIKDGMPDDILVCLFVKKDGKMQHTGFGYHGETVECSSNVQYFPKRKSKWTHWAVAKGVTGDIPDYKPTLRRGDKGPYVTLAQTDLLRLGYDLGKYGVDGDFGKATEAAVKNCQRDYGLTVDGVVGPRTWEVLENTHATLYTVTVPHLTKGAAEALVGQYSGATMTEEKE